MPAGNGGAMDTAQLKVLFRLLGTCFLMAAGTGAGILACQHKRKGWHQLYTWYRLFFYFQQLLGYQSLTGEEMMMYAREYPEFEELQLENCASLEELPLPEMLTAACRKEIRSALFQLAMAPRTVARQTLAHIAELFREAAAQKDREVQAVDKLWPRLGFCAGVLAAILLW